jgi:hypothetical protein
MNVDTLISKNGTVQLVLTPENDMEKEILRVLNKQDNVIQEIRNPVNIFGRTIRDCVLITSESGVVERDDKSQAQTV